MFEVLVFVYENYFTGESCPEPAHLERKLNAVGFEADEVADAIAWLKGLTIASRDSLGANAQFCATQRTRTVASRTVALQRAHLHHGGATPLGYAVPGIHLLYGVCRRTGRPHA